MPEATPAHKFDLLCKAEDLVIGNLMEVAGTIYKVQGLGFNGLDSVEVILFEANENFHREVTIRCDAEHIFGIWREKE